MSDHRETDADEGHPTGHKRRRDDDERSTVEDGVVYNRPEDLWYADGNIVVQVDEMQFKVHISRLCQASPIFASQIEQNLSTNAQADGVPLLILHGINSAEVDHGLRAIFNHTSPVALRTDNYYYFDYRTYSSVLRFSTKFGIDILREQVVSMLRNRFVGLDLARWDLNRYDRQTALDHFPPFSFDLLNLARETRAHQVLAAAYYLCSCQGIAEIIGGIEAPDGHRVCLSAAVQVDCIRGGIAIKKARDTGILQQWLDPMDSRPSAQACSRTTCARARHALRQAALDEGPLSVHPLDKWKADWEHGLCADCVGAGKQVYVCVREELYKNLSSFFMATV